MSRDDKIDLALLFLAVVSAVGAVLVGKLAKRST